MARTKILLEGRPGSGKTTVARKIAGLLQDAGISLCGFVTDELRRRGERIGFAVETFGGDRATLAHVDLPGPPRVSRYGVDLGAFEALALPELAAADAGSVLLVDEIGKMELASDAFRARIAELFERRLRIVATIQVARDPLTDRLKRRRDVDVIRVTARERDALPKIVAGRFRQ